MDSDSDVPLANYAEINYLRKKIAWLEKFVAEKRPECSRRQRLGVGCFLESQWRIPFTRQLPQPHCRQSSNEKYEALDGVRRQTERKRQERHKPMR